MSCCDFRELSVAVARQFIHFAFIYTFVCRLSRYANMGILSGWFSSSSSSAGKVESNKQPAGPAAASKPNVWRSVFDPGSNPNIDKVGSSYYDTVHKVSVVPSTCMGDVYHLHAGVCLWIGCTPNMRSATPLVN